MSDGSDKMANAVAALDAQARLLEQAAIYSTDACLIAKLLAIQNTTVRQKLEERLQNIAVYEPRGVQCLDPDAFGNQRVLFRFACRPPIICLVDPSFLAIVNIPLRRVEIQDPYIPTAVGADTGSGCSCAGAAPSAPTARGCLPGQVPPRPTILEDCATITIENGKACLSIPYAGDVCVSVPDWVPNGTVAEACVKVCKKFGVPIGARVSVVVAGTTVACNSWGECDC